MIRRHFADRDASEEAYFADAAAVAPPSRAVAPGGCNDPDELAVMRRLEPDVVLVFGTGMLKLPLIERIR